MKNNAENKFTRFCIQFRLSSAAKKKALRWAKNNPATAEELMWLFQRRNDLSTVRLNRVFESPPSLWPLMTLTLNYWKAVKIYRCILNGYHKKRTVTSNGVYFVGPPSKPVTFTMPNGVVCTAQKGVTGGYPRVVYEFEFTVKGQKVILDRGSQLVKQTVETLVNHAVLITAKAWHWVFENRCYSIDSKDGKIFRTMIEQNVAREVATLLIEDSAKPHP
jgi:hypothetical protein